ncbi:glutamyl-tRNA reductase [Sulfolobales archaeon HS-7]|nr:glutamyl-tRNA reductase [Sulfolobales archaeon HS-7]
MAQLVNNIIGNYGLISVTYRQVPITKLGEHYIKENEVKYLRNITQGEFFLLQTCNRIEIYVFSTSVNDEIEKLITTINEFHGEDIGKYAIISYGKDVVDHAFKVAAGLDSLSLGEYEILGQISQSLKYMEERGMSGKYISLLFERAIKAGRRIRIETELSRGKVGVYSLAFELVKEKIDLRRAKVLVIGAGNFAEKILSFLKELEAKDTTIMNRTVERGVDLARRYNVKFLPLNLNSLGNYDVIFSAAPVGRDIKLDSRTLTIDFSVPPSFVGDNVITLDELRDISERNYSLRKTVLGEAERILIEEEENFTKEILDEIYDSYISTMMQRIERIRRSQVDRAKSELMKKGVSSPYVFEIIDVMTRSITQKAMDPVFQKLKGMIMEGNLTMAEEITKIFGEVNGGISDSKTEKTEKK